LLAPSRRLQSTAEGYTTIEMLIAITLVGLAAALALPALLRWSEGVDARADETRVVGELGGLGFRAWAAGKPITLDDAHAHEVLRHLPATWQAHLDSPILFAPLGTCSGGSITLIDTAGARRIFRLAPITCDVGVE
jgi:hypothetical protein